MHRGEFNELTHLVTKRKKELKNLTEIWLNLEEMYDTKKIEEKIKFANQQLNDLDMKVMIEHHQAECLNMKLECCKTDLRAFRMKIRRLEKLLRKKTFEESQLNSREERLRVQMTKLAVERKKKKMSFGEMNGEPLYKENLEKELNAFEGKETLKNIEELERQIEKKKHIEMIKERLENHVKKDTEHRDKWRAQKALYEDKEHTLRECERDLDQLLKEMKISDYNMIEKTYVNLR